ncbi:MAG TPA: MarR family transcriptional regulator [Stackebrandtia sp.]|uniref:MarR family winged helix-turn-helix transcriptional regulator n=1 Tax=Stackebrandtia sp. TaxID=2023065 RepID=UPI002D41F83D|nr:MarR family transcriptional regulator [Stackebrandtia sp.]HZE38090.1 MarR family transcriptional regulator [Stackebrandtia sp.]
MHTHDDIDAVTAAVLTTSRLFVAISARSLAAMEETVTLPQYRMLVVLSTRDSAKLVDLADQLGVNPSTATRMITRLIKADLVVQEVNPDNRRERVIRLKPAGRRLVDDVTSHRRAEIAAIITRMPSAQRGALAEALNAFNEAGGRTSVPPG